MIVLPSRVFGPIKFDESATDHGVWKHVKLALPGAARSFRLSVASELGSDRAALARRVAWLEGLAKLDRVAREHMQTEFAATRRTDRTVADFLTSHLEEMDPADLRRALKLPRSHTPTASDVLDHLLLRGVSIWNAKETVFDYGLEDRVSDQLLVAYWGPRGAFRTFSHES